MVNEKGCIQGVRLRSKARRRSSSFEKRSSDTSALEFGWVLNSDISASISDDSIVEQAVFFEKRFGTHGTLPGHEDPFNCKSNLEETCRAAP